MPIYEFYCSACHMLFSFLARTPSKRRPACPRCRKPRIERKVSAFAISKGRPEPSGGDDLPEGMDENRIEQAMASMAQEMENVNEDDPRGMAGMMRKLFDRTGMQLGEGMEQAIRRMEAGEDPDKIEDEMGDLLEGEQPEFGEQPAGLARLRRKLKAPRVDETLYEL